MLARSVLFRKPCSVTKSAVAHRGSRQQRLQVMAFTSRTDKMLEVGRQYMKAWQGDVPQDQLAAHLKPIIAPSGVRFHADGVVHLEDRVKSFEDVSTHIQDRHRAYKHVLHDLFAMAVDESTNSVFMGVRYLMQSQAPVAGQEPTGWPSQGVLLERLVLDEQDHIKEALVCRQLTREEQGALTIDPSEVKPPPLDDKLLYAPEEKLSTQDQEAMKSTIERWVHCWDSDSNPDEISKVLAPDVQQLAGYGLAKRSVPFQGVEGAQQAIQGALKHMENKNTLLSSAVCADRRAGFVHWQANMLVQGQGSPQTMQGLDYLRFTPDNKISLIFSFTMKPYSNVREDAAPRKLSVD